MKKVISKGIIFLLLMMSMMGLAACSQEIMFDDQTVSLSQRSKKVCDIELYVKQEVKLGKYEPYEGIYLGAYVEKNKNINGEIAVFEELVNKTQAFKVFQYTMGEGLSAKEILKCMAERKVPYIKLLLGSNQDLTPLYRMISDINAPYDVPVFIELFPLTANLSQPEHYKKTYERAYEIIHKYLDNVVIVWSVDDSRIYDMPLYYPGDEIVDWAGINVYIPKYKDNSPYTFNAEETLDFWYKSFQKSKPMIISSLAVSHYSRADHAYTLNDAINKLNFFYGELPKRYPRIKGILYIDVDMGEVTRMGKDDYRITSQKQLYDFMKLKLKNKLFIHEADDLPVKKSVDLYMKYRIVTTKFDEDIYLNKKYMTALFKKVPLSKLTMIQDLDGEKYYKLDDVKLYADIYYETKEQ